MIESRQADTGIYPSQTFDVPKEGKILFFIRLQRSVQGRVFELVGHFKEKGDKLSQRV